MKRPSLAEMFRRLVLSANEKHKNRKAQARQRRGRRDLAIELLEDRVVPATFIVDSPADNETADSVTTLREAIAQANASPDPQSTITFDAGVFAVGGTDSIELDLGQLKITGNVSIDGRIGGGASIEITLDPATPVGNTSRHFRITGDVGLANIDITGPATTLVTENGGAIVVDNGASLLLENSRLRDNHNTSFNGGAIFNQGSLTVRNSVFTENVAVRGGAISNDGELFIASSVFDSNSASDAAGAVFVGQGMVTIVNSTLVRNDAPFAGAIGSFGAATIESSTIVENSGTATGAVSSFEGTLTLENSIVANNGGGAGDFTIGGTTHVRFSLVESGDAPNGDNVNNQFGVDPMLTEASYGDGRTVFKLQAGSPAIDAGSNTLVHPLRMFADQRGATGVVFSNSGRIVDIGAHELNPLPEFVVTNTNDDGAGSLRQAITDANVAGGQILFDIPNSGPHTIALASALPAIDARVFVEGLTQSGSWPNESARDFDARLNIILDGAGTEFEHGIQLTPNAVEAVVRGLDIRNFDGRGVNIKALGSHVEGNRVAESGIGMYVLGFDNKIGDDLEEFDTALVHRRNLIENSDHSGIQVGAPPDSVGFMNRMSGNLIRGSGVYGVNIVDASSSNTVNRNIIAGNGGRGITLQDLRRDGVFGTGNDFFGNALFANGDIGIDLNNDGITPNDDRDADDGPNRLQNFPVLNDAAVRADGSVAVDLTFNAEPVTEYLVDLFATLPSTAPNAEDVEAEFFLGFVQFITDVNGNFSGLVEIPDPESDVPADVWFTATATHGNFFDTSELSAPIRTSLPTADIIDVVPDPSQNLVGFVEISFSEDVTGVDVTDFRLTRNGGFVPISSDSLIVSSPSAYSLDLTDETNDEGVYQLTLVAAGSNIEDSLGNVLAMDAVDEFTVDRSPPTVEIAEVIPNPRNTNVGIVTITFSEEVTDVGVEDFQLTRDGNTVALSADSLQGSGSIFQLDLTEATAAGGEYELSVLPFNIADRAGNVFSDGASRMFTVDTTPPTADIVDVTPDPRTTNAGVVMITFTETVTGVDVGDFTLTRNGAAVTLSPNSLTGSQSSYSLNLADETAEAGNYVLTLVASGSGIQDAAGNDLLANASDAFTVEAGGSVLTADITDVSPDPRNEVVEFVTITFSADVTGFGDGDVILERDGDAVDPARLGSVRQITAREYRINLSGATAEAGDYELTVPTTVGIQDSQGNPLSAPAVDTWTNLGIGAEIEPNGTTATATTLPQGTVGHGDGASGDADDFYRVPSVRADSLLFAMVDTGDPVRSLDLVVGPGGAGAAGVVNRFLSSGTPVGSFFPYPGFDNAVRVATGDVNGDGTPDIITGTGGGGPAHVKVFDGRTLGELASFFAYGSFLGGVFVAAGDVNGDGFADIITGADAGGQPHVKVFDGATGAETRSFFAYDGGFQGGVRVAAGDVNGDGFADIITGIGPGGAHVKAFSGSTGGELASFFAYPGFTGGVFVAAGDVNGDGRADIITGSDSLSSHVKAFDGATLAELHSFFAYPGANFGVRVAAGDVNGDGRADIITGIGPGALPHVQAFDGATQGLLASFLAYGPGFQGGVFVAGADVVVPRPAASLTALSDTSQQFAGGESIAAIAGAAVPADGNVFLQVNTGVEYRLHQAIVPLDNAAPENEANNTRATADDIRAAITIGTTDAADYYRLTPPVGSRVVVFVDNDPNPLGASATRVDLVHGAGETLIASATTENNVTVVAGTAPGSGDLFIKITNTGTAGRAYHLVVMVDGVVVTRPVVTNTNDAGPGSLRQALLDYAAFSDNGLGWIDFAIEGPGFVYTITPERPLPEIDHPVVIDGYSQLGAQPNSSLEALDNGNRRVVLDGSTANGVGLSFEPGADQSALFGLIVQEWETAIAVHTDDVAIIGNIIAGQTGVLVTGENNRIGSPAPPNESTPPEPAFRNIINGGIVLAGSANQVRNNHVVTSSTDGILIRSGGNVIHANSIAINGQAGIAVEAVPGAVHNHFSANSINNNGGLGIDLGLNGVSGNDPRDGDTGPNNRQNFPVLTAFVPTAGRTAGDLSGRLHSVPNSDFIIELFQNVEADLTGHGEGLFYLGFVRVRTDARGNATFSATVELEIPDATIFTATATREFIVGGVTVRETSEFSPALGAQVAVSAVRVRGTSWTSNTAGFPIPDSFGEYQLLPLPWTNLNVIAIQFTAAMELTRDLFTVTGSSSTYNITDFFFSQQFVAVLTLDRPLATDVITLTIRADGPDGAQSTGGVALDGEWDNPDGPTDSESDTFPSGNGTPGGNFTFRFNVAPGSVDGDGDVDVFDVLLTRLRIGQSEESPDFDGIFDVDGNGIVNVLDLLLTRLRIGSSLPLVQSEPSAGLVASGTAPLALTALLEWIDTDPLPAGPADDRTPGAQNSPTAEDWTTVERRAPNEVQPTQTNRRSRHRRLSSPATNLIDAVLGSWFD